MLCVRTLYPKRKQNLLGLLKTRGGECHARANTISIGGGNFSVFEGPNELPKHFHPPNREYAEAEKLKISLKRKAAEHLEEQPSQLIRNELAGVAS